MSTASRTLRRHIVDAGWRSFLDMVAYKASSAGKLAVFVERRARRRSVPRAGLLSRKNCVTGYTIARIADSSRTGPQMLLWSS